MEKKNFWLRLAVFGSQKLWICSILAFGSPKLPEGWRKNQQFLPLKQKTKYFCVPGKLDEVRHSCCHMSCLWDCGGSLALQLWHNHYKKYLPERVESSFLHKNDFFSIQTVISCAKLIFSLSLKFHDISGFTCTISHFSFCMSRVKKTKKNIIL